jgi:hypothetical protein
MTFSSDMSEEELYKKLVEMKAERDELRRLAVTICADNNGLWLGDDETDYHGDLSALRVKMPSSTTQSAPSSSRGDRWRSAPWLRPRAFRGCGVMSNGRSASLRGA